MIKYIHYCLHEITPNFSQNNPFIFNNQQPVRLKFLKIINLIFKITFKINSIYFSEVFII